MNTPRAASKSRCDPEQFGDYGGGMIYAADPDAVGDDGFVVAGLDRGTRWRLPSWEISRIQVALDAPRAPTGVVTALRRAADALYRAAATDC
jgi:hypothetical protein